MAALELRFVFGGSGAASLGGAGGASRELSISVITRCFRLIVSPVRYRALAAAPTIYVDIIPLMIRLFGLRFAAKG